MISAGDYKENKRENNSSVGSSSSKRTLPKKIRNDIKIKEFQKQLQNIDSHPSLDLVATLVQRLSLLESELENVKKDFKEAKQMMKQKDVYISKLKNDMITESKGYAILSKQDKLNLQLPTEFYDLQNKVIDMEKFLFGYYAAQFEKQKNVEEFNIDEEWKEEEFNPNFDDLIEIIQRMNLENSEPQIMHTEQGAKLQTCDVVELTLFANGMISGDFPFRSYSQSSVQAYLLDIQDGYYPSELQENNPEGVIFKVCDRRYEIYNPSKTLLGLFGGHGMTLGSKSCYNPREQSNRVNEWVWQPLASVTDKFEDSSPHRQHKTDFAKYESSGSKTSRTLRIKNGVLLKMADDPIQNIKNKKLVPTKPIVLNKPTNKKNEITLKIKGFEGESMYIVSVLAQDTLGTLLSLLPIEGMYTLAYRDDKNRVQTLKTVQATLRSYGICQSCMLFTVKL